MKSALSGLGGAGGTLAVAAFFVPWLSVSCNDAPVVDVSAYDRAAGRLQSAAVNANAGLADQLDAAPEYWSLLAIPVALITLCGALAVSPPRLHRRLGLVLVCVGLIGLALLTVLWLEQRFGLGAMDRAPPGLELTVSLQLGGWIAFGGHLLVVSTGLVAAALGPRLS